MADTTEQRRRVLRTERAPSRASLLEATTLPDGGIQIRGVDASNGVGEGDEYQHYEWTWTVEAGNLAAALGALDGKAGDDPLDVLESWVIHHRSDPGTAIRMAGIPVTFSSDVAD